MITEPSSSNYKQDYYYTNLKTKQSSIQLNNRTRSKSPLSPSKTILGSIKKGIRYRIVVDHLPIHYACSSSAVGPGGEGERAISGTFQFLVWLFFLFDSCLPEIELGLAPVRLLLLESKILPIVIAQQDERCE